jgi:tRNA pseudouridine55 synthase
MPNGILLLDKPQGLTSNGALQRVRKAYGAESAGHVGTLDPMATGMLPICLDEATKVIAEIESGAKAYEFTVQLGTRTDTGDAEGQVAETQAVPPLDDAAVERVLARFRGVQQQVPPMYSALKREGQPLYALARKGIEVERAARTIDIRRLVFVGRGPDSLRLTCECAKGTYIRVLGEDIARALGTCGHLTQLRRPWVEPFRDMPMFSLDAAPARRSPGAAHRRAGGVRTQRPGGAQSGRAFGRGRPAGAPVRARRRFSGSGRGPARRGFAAATADAFIDFVNLCFTEPFL